MTLFPPKSAFTPEQLDAVISHEKAIGIYDGRYDDIPLEQIQGKIEADISEPMPSQPETQVRRSPGRPKGR